MSLSPFRPYQSQNGAAPPSHPSAPKNPSAPAPRAHAELVLVGVPFYVEGSLPPKSPTSRPVSPTSVANGKGCATTYPTPSLDGGGASTHVFSDLEAGTPTFSPRDAGTSPTAPPCSLTLTGSTPSSHSQSPGSRFIGVLQAIQGKRGVFAQMTPPSASHPSPSPAVAAMAKEALSLLPASRSASHSVVVRTESPHSPAPSSGVVTEDETRLTADALARLEWEQRHHSPRPPEEAGAHETRTPGEGDSSLNLAQLDNSALEDLPVPPRGRSESPPIRDRAALDALSESGRSLPTPPLLQPRRRPDSPALSLQHQPREDLSLLVTEVSRISTPESLMPLNPDPQPFETAPPKKPWFIRALRVIKYILILPVFSSSILGILGMFISFGSAAPLISLVALSILVVYLLLNTLPETAVGFYKMWKNDLFNSPPRKIFWGVLKQLCVLMCGVTLSLAIYVGVAGYLTIAISSPLLWSIFGIGLFHTTLITILDIRAIYYSFQGADTWRECLRKNWPSLLCASIGLLGGATGSVIGGIQVGTSLFGASSDAMADGVSSWFICAGVLLFCLQLLHKKRAHSPERALAASSYSNLSHSTSTSHGRTLSASPVCPA